MRRILATARTILRPFEFRDCTELHEIFGDPATHTIGDGPFTSPETSGGQLVYLVSPRLAGQARSAGVASE